MLRTGLVERDNPKDMIEIARRLNPGYPGVLDLPAWTIGNRWCHPKRPECNKCVMPTTCPRLLGPAKPVSKGT